MSMKVSSKLAALKGLDARLREIRRYLDLVIEEKLPLNHEILYHLQVSLSVAGVICFELYPKRDKEPFGSYFFYIIVQNFLYTKCLSIHALW
jgi:hypothetical protein